MLFQFLSSYHFVCAPWILVFLDIFSKTYWKWTFAYQHKIRRALKFGSYSFLRWNYCLFQLRLPYVMFFVKFKTLDLFRVQRPWQYKWEALTHASMASGMAIRGQFLHARLHRYTLSVLSVNGVCRKCLFIQFDLFKKINSNKLGKSKDTQSKKLFVCWAIAFVWGLWTDIPIATWKTPRHKT